MICCGRLMTDDAPLRPDQARSEAVPDRHAPLTAADDGGVRRLWAAVIAAALADAGSPRERVREAVRRWVGSDDFWHCCECAGFDPRRTATVFRRALAAPARPVRAAHGGRRQQAAA